MENRMESIIKCLVDTTFLVSTYMPLIEDLKYQINNTISIAIAISN